MNKVVILFIYDGSTEVDWILPLIYKLKKNHKIFTYFNGSKSFNNLKTNKDLFGLWKKTTSEYYVQKNIDNFFWKVLYRIVKLLNIKHQKFNDFLILKIHDHYKLKNKLKQIFKIDDLKVKYIFSLLSKNSGWTVNYKTVFKESKLIHYPNNTFNYSLKNKKKNITHSFSLSGDILLLANKDTIPYCKNLIDKKKILICGTPKYDYFWINILKKNINRKFDFKYDLIKNKYVIIFAYTSFFNLYKDIDEALHTQLYDIVSAVLSFKNTILIFKIHPRANSKVFLKTLNKFDKSRWLISKNHILSLASISNLFLHTPLTSTITDALFLKIPTIEIWNVSNKIYFNERKIFDEQGLVNKVKNKNELSNLLKNKIYNQNNILISKQFIKFNKIYRHNLRSVDFIIKKINTI